MVGMGVHLLLSRLYNSDECATGRFSKISTSDSEWSSIDVYPPRPEKNPRVVGSCNGLLCLVYPRDVYALWNPANGTFQKIPPSKLIPHPCVVCTDDETRDRNMCRGTTRYSKLRALAFDAESQDYKFVRFVDTFYETEDGNFFDHGESVQLEVYSLRNNSWKEVDPFPSPRRYLFCDCSNAVYVNGCCYLDCSDGNIASLDMLNHKFSLLPCPGIASKRGDFNVFLLELQGSLGVVIYPLKCITKLFSFWIYAPSSSSWTRQISLDVRLVGADKPLWFGKNDRNSQSLLLQGVDGALLEYDYAVQKLKKIDEIFDFKRSMSIYPYVETNHNLILRRRK